MIDFDSIRAQVTEYQRCVREGEDAGFAFRDDPADLVAALLAEADRSAAAKRLGSSLIAIAKSQGSDDDKVRWYVDALEKDAVRLAKSPMGDLGRMMILTEREGGDGLLERVVEFVAHSPASGGRLGTSTQQQVLDLRAELAAEEETSKQRAVYIDVLQKRLDEAEVPASRLEAECIRGRSALWAEVAGAVAEPLHVAADKLLRAGPARGMALLRERLEVMSAREADLACLWRTINIEDLLPDEPAGDGAMPIIRTLRRAKEGFASPPSPAVTNKPAPATSGNKYHRTVYDITPGSPGSVTIDVYSVLIAFDVRDPGLQHAAKKILCAGIRGKASRSQDLREARDALDRAIQEADRAENGGA